MHYSCTSAIAETVLGVEGGSTMSSLRELVVIKLFEVNDEANARVESDFACISTLAMMVQLTFQLYLELLS